MYDVVIIGAGVSGSAVARELSRYDLKICVVEKEEDVCCGTSKANSAIVHAGFDAENGSLMAKLNVEGNEMMEELSKELDFHFKKNGSLVVCLNEEDRPDLEALYERGVKNGVKELRIIEREELAALEDRLYYIDQSTLDAINERIDASETPDIIKTPDPFAPEEMEQPIPVGIDVSDCEKLSDVYYYEDGKAFLGIAYNTNHIDMVKTFLTYISVLE